MLKNLIGLTIVALLSFITPADACGQRNNQNIPTDDIFDLELDENLTTPKIGNNQKSIIQEFQHAQAKRLLKQDVEVEMMRQGEVIVATILSDLLFAPNDTLLLSSSEKYLHPFLVFFRTAGLYKIVLVMHSDDTGSQEYTYSLTEKRVNAIYDWFEQMSVDTSLLVPYAMGDSDPLVTNNSRKNRQKNRRLEIYLVPGPTMISRAKSGSLR